MLCLFYTPWLASFWLSWAVFSTFAYNNARTWKCCQKSLTFAISASTLIPD